MLLPRIGTAVAAVPLVLYLIHLGGFPFLAFTALLSALACREYALILRIGGRGVQPWVTTAGGALIALAVGLSGPVSTKAPAPGVGLNHLAVTALVLAALLREVLRREHSLDRAALSVLGPLFIGWPLGHLVLLRELPVHGEVFCLLLFAGVWMTDIAAWAAGTALGRRKMAPVLSPKKSWEGAAAGLAAAILTLWLGRWLFLRETLGPGLALALGLLVGTLGQASDATESLVKRASGVKDSSGLLPGHGGVFDRMDSFFLLAPAFYYAIVLLGGNS
ncbi:MAG: phosphatidate cytidylyltransferase [Elusimicrobia bacterium]|nr:phosphatidate cytidylyltransferase [Elusimicrobiota bacterium]